MAQGFNKFRQEKKRSPPQIIRVSLEASPYDSLWTIMQHNGEEKEQVGERNLRLKKCVHACVRRSSFALPSGFSREIPLPVRRACLVRDSRLS